LPLETRCSPFAAGAREMVQIFLKKLADRARAQL
jgi:hypothetical protein